MGNSRHIIGYLFGLALALAGLTSAASAQTTAPKGNGKIAFVSVKGGPVYIDNAGIYVMNPDGSGRAQLTSTRIMCPPPNRPPGSSCGADQLDYSPAWSPDGRQIAFVRSVSAPNFRYAAEVFVMNADASDQRQLTQLGGFVHVLSRPAWSPGGTKLALVGPHLGDYYSQVYVMSADGSGPRPVGRGVDPAWSPDGSKLAFSSGGLHLMNPDGSGRTPITTPQNPAPLLVDYDWAPVWSPDGTRILFNRSVGCDWDDACESITIWTVNADGSNPSKLANIEAYGRLAWSPDGKKILFSANGDLFTMEADGSNVTNITNTPDESEWMPSWQPVDLDVPPGIYPIDDPQFFVRQHYLDFLNREPDASGLAFWANEITACGGDAGCVEAKRVNVSAAFFLSIEFQETGYLAYRMYKAAYGDATDASTGLAVPVVKRTELVADSTLVGQNVVVNSQGWEQQLAANKQAYASAFVRRQRFADAYPPSMTPAAFVARLNENTGGALTQAEVDALVAELSASQTAEGRASVLRKVAENVEVERRERHRAFVLMQYFGYLRRNPDDLPDAGFGGYNFWLQKLEQFGGDFVRAEMVKAFLDSIEYRRRFGQP
jgi:hypothetical protein